VLDDIMNGLTETANEAPEAQAEPAEEGQEEVEEEEWDEEAKEAAREAQWREEEEMLLERQPDPPPNVAEILQRQMDEEELDLRCRQLLQELSETQLQAAEAKRKKAEDEAAEETRRKEQEAAEETRRKEQEDEAKRVAEEATSAPASAGGQAEAVDEVETMRKEQEEKDEEAKRVEEEEQPMAKVRLISMTHQLRREFVYDKGVAISVLKQDICNAMIQANKRGNWTAARLFIFPSGGGWHPMGPETTFDVDTEFVFFLESPRLFANMRSADKQRQEQADKDMQATAPVSAGRPEAVPAEEAQRPRTKRHRSAPASAGQPPAKQAKQAAEAAAAPASDEQQLEAFLQSLPVTGIRTKKSYEDAIFVKVLLDSQHGEKLQQEAASGKPQDQLARDYATLVQLIGDFEAAQLELASGSASTAAPATATPASAPGSAASTGSAPGSSAGRATPGGQTEKLAKLIKKRASLLSLRLHHKNNPQQLEKVQEELTVVKEQIAQIRGKVIPPMLTAHRRGHEDTNQVFATGIDHISRAFQQMADLHTQAAAVLEQVAEDAADM
jgi:hypothetical protein